MKKIMFLLFALVPFFVSAEGYQCRSCDIHTIFLKHHEKIETLLPYCQMTTWEKGIDDRMFFDEGEVFLSSVSAKQGAKIAGVIEAQTTEKEESDPQNVDELVDLITNHLERFYSLEINGLQVTDIKTEILDRSEHSLLFFLVARYQTSEECFDIGVFKINFSGDLIEATSLEYHALAHQELDEFLFQELPMVIDKI